MIGRLIWFYLRSSAFICGSLPLCVNLRDQTIQFKPMRPDFQTIDEITRRLAESVPGEFKTARVEVEKQFRTVLENTFSRLDLVTREEFEIQKKVLLRTREKLERLEALLIEKEKPAAD